VGDAHFVRVAFVLKCSDWSDVNVATERSEGVVGDVAIDVGPVDVETGEYTVLFSELFESWVGMSARKTNVGDSLVVVAIGGGG